MPAFHSGIPIRIHISGTPHAVLQIDWPLWLCDCSVIEQLVRSVEIIQALWSFPPESDLEIDSLCNGPCQQDSKNAESYWGRQALRSNWGQMRAATVRLPAGDR